jgi:hypothetical protein
VKRAILGTVAFLLLAGCGGASPPLAPTGSRSDEIWYVRHSAFKSEVFYCPPSEGPGQKVCKKAVMHEP